jgi:hypothetical protein
MRKANLPLNLIKNNSSVSSGAESKYKIINVKHHRRMKRSAADGEAEIDSTINIKISDMKGEENYCKLGYVRRSC